MTKKVLITDKKKMQLNMLKGDLEDLELYLREIEDALTELDNSTDENATQNCHMRLMQIQQRIAMMCVPEAPDNTDQN